MAIPDRIRAKLEELAGRHRSILDQLENPEVQADHRKMADLARESGKLEKAASLWKQLTDLERTRTENQELIDGDDDELVELAKEEFQGLPQREAELLEVIKDALISGEEEDRPSVIVEIRAGTGGEEAALWSGDLFRMYSRFAEAKGWKIEILDASETEGKGFKEVDFRISGAPEVYRTLQFEAGGHRVQRVPETESQGRIHTSAATVAIMPEVEDVEIEIKEEDLDITAMRAGGPGGQHQNKTSSAIRMVHKPTGEQVVCREKSQHQNRKEALRILKAKLFQRQKEEADRTRADQRRSMLGSGDRSMRIRTYNFPQNRVTDHRIGRNFSLEIIVDGRLDPLVEALQEFDREERLQEL